MANLFPFLESLLTLICSRLSDAANSALFAAERSPATVEPARFTPRYVNTGMICYLLFYSYRRTGALPPPAGGEVTPRLIRSCNSSGFEDRASAVSKVIDFWK